MTNRIQKALEKARSLLFYKVIPREEHAAALAVIEAVNAWDYHNGPWADVAEALEAWASSVLGDEA